MLAGSQWALWPSLVATYQVQEGLALTALQCRKERIKMAVYTVYAQSVSDEFSGEGTIVKLDRKSVV